LVFGVVSDILMVTYHGLFAMMGAVHMSHIDASLSAINEYKMNNKSRAMEIVLSVKIGCFLSGIYIAYYNNA